MEPLAGVAPQLGDYTKSSLRLVTQLSDRESQSKHSVFTERYVSHFFQQDFYAATFQLQQDLYTIGFVVTEKWLQGWDSNPRILAYETSVLTS